MESRASSADKTMIITVVLVILAAATLAFLISQARGRSLAIKALADPATHVQSVDLNAFRNLIDPQEESFLRDELPTHEFRKIQRERMRAAIEYVTCAAQNASILLRLAQDARHSADPAAVESAEKLMESAIQLRLYAMRTIVRLYVAILIPGAGLSDTRVADRYEQMTRLVVRLGLQYPTRGLPAAL